MSVTFKGSYTKNHGAQPVALGRIWITPHGEPTVTLQTDADGHYEYVSTSTKEHFVIVEQFGDRRTLDVAAAAGTTVDTSTDVGAQLDSDEPYGDAGIFTDFDGVQHVVPDPTPNEEP